MKEREIAPFSLTLSASQGSVHLASLGHNWRWVWISGLSRGACHAVRILDILPGASEKKAGARRDCKEGVE